MTTKTALTDTQAVDLAFMAGLHMADLGSATQERAMVMFARIIEQAVLQSPEVQRLRNDAGRYRYIKANISKDYDLPGGYYLPDEDTESWDRTIDASAGILP